MKKIVVVVGLLVAFQGAALYAQEVQANEQEESHKMDEETVRLVLSCVKELQQAMKEVEELNAKVAIIEQQRQGR